MSGATVRLEVRRLYCRFSRSASMRARVSVETPERPLRTFETVDIETSASEATSARVARLGRRFPDDPPSIMRNSVSIMTLFAKLSGRGAEIARRAGGLARD